MSVVVVIVIIVRPLVNVTRHSSFRSVIVILLIHVVQTYKCKYALSTVYYITCQWLSIAVFVLCLSSYVWQWAVINFGVCMRCFSLSHMTNGSWTTNGWRNIGLCRNNGKTAIVARIERHTSFELRLSYANVYYPRKSEGLWNHRRWFVCLSVRLFVCLFVSTILNKTWTDLDEIFWEGF